MKKLRVLALVPYPTGRVPGQRFRIEQWAPRLEQPDLTLTFLAFLSSRGMDLLYQPGHTLGKVREILAGHRRHLLVLRQLASWDVVFLFREAALASPPLLERAITRRRPLVFDFDDAIYLPPPNSPNRWVSQIRTKGKTATICRLATHITAGNETLADYARLLSSAVSIVPTTIDTDLYVPRDRAANARPVIGWSGSSSTLPYLTALREPLLVLQQRVTFDLRVIGGDVTMNGLNPKCLPWRAESEVDDLRPIDVGLMPLPYNAWARGKCGLKALQYMALGIPPVVSPIGVNRQIVRDGVNGFHASTDREWVSKTELLLTDGSLRRRLGTAARETVKERYSTEVWVPVVRDILMAAKHQRR